MKTKEEARKIAHAKLTEACKKADLLRRKAESINDKPFSKNVEIRIKRYNEINKLKEEAEKIENEGRKIWGNFLNTPEYWLNGGPCENWTEVSKTL